VTGGAPDERRYYGLDALRFDLDWPWRAQRPLVAALGKAK